MTERLHRSQALGHVTMHHSHHYNPKGVRQPQRERTLQCLNRESHFTNHRLTKCTRRNRRKLWRSNLITDSPNRLEALVAMKL